VTIHLLKSVGTAALAGWIALPAAIAADSGPSDRFGARPETESRFSLTVGAELTTGDYGADADTDVLYVPVTGRWESGPNTLNLTVPYIRVSAPSTTGGTVVGSDRMGRPIRRGAAASERVTESGLGDVLASYGRLLLEHDSMTLDAIARIKLGTADETRGLGSGENDYAAQLDGYWAVGPWTALGTVGYKVLGDPPGTDFDNVFFGALGASLSRGDTAAFGAIYDYSQATTPASDPQRQITLYAAGHINRGTRLEAYVLKGYGDTSPDRGAGILLTTSF
jgi:hypothetical protein